MRLFHFLFSSGHVDLLLPWLLQGGEVWRVATSLRIQVDG